MPSRAAAAGPSTPPPTGPQDSVILEELDLPKAHQVGEGWEQVLGSLSGVPSRAVLEVAARHLSVLTWDWLTKAFPDAEESQDRALAALLAILHSIKPGLHDHSERVGAMAERLAREVELTGYEQFLAGRAAELRDAGLVGIELASMGEGARGRLAAELRSGRLSLWAAGTFHDIGKLQIPRGILYKAGPLTEEEQRIVRLHPVVGEQILAAIPGTDPILPAVRGHHERWDGHGYPDSLSALDIPVAARMIALVDSFDALTNMRPYRAALPRSTAIREILYGSGTQFDPELTALFVAMVTR